jgi:hypothetical protein
MIQRHLDDGALVCFAIFDTAQFSESIVTLIGSKHTTLLPLPTRSPLLFEVLQSTVSHVPTPASRCPPCLAYS